jgi:hypothetical protein
MAYINSAPAAATILGAWSIMLMCWMRMISEAKVATDRINPMVTETWGSAALGTSTGGTTRAVRMQ